MRISYPQKNICELLKNASLCKLVGVGKHVSCFCCCGVTNSSGDLWNDTPKVETFIISIRQKNRKLKIHAGGYKEMSSIFADQ